MEQSLERIVCNVWVVNCTTLELYNHYTIPHSRTVTIFDTILVLKPKSISPETIPRFVCYLTLKGIWRYILTPLHIPSVSNWALILSKNSPLSLLPHTTLSKPATSFSGANELWMRPLALIECVNEGLNLRLIVIDWKGYLLLFRNFLKENTCRV